MKKESYTTIVQTRITKHFPSTLMGGKYKGEPRDHIFKELKDNFIDGDFPKQKSLKGNLTNSDIKYHYAEHVNSSQTMCISFFKKFFESHENEILLAEILILLGLNISGNEFTDAVFEYVPYPNENTNFDFFLKLTDGRQISWEVKFTEQEFGSISPSKKHPKRYIEKWKEIYTDMLSNCVYDSYINIECKDYNCIKNGKLSNKCNRYNQCPVYEFYKNYQIRRNILYAKSPGDYVLFLTPRENNSKALNTGRNYIEQCAKKAGTACICNIYWEDLIEITLHVVSINPSLFDYYTKFKNKYFQ